MEAEWRMGHCSAGEGKFHGPVVHTSGMAVRIVQRGPLGGSVEPWALDFSLGCDHDPRVVGSSSTWGSMLSMKPV